MTTMTDEQATALSLTFDDLYVLTAEDPEGEVDVFVLNWNEAPASPPYHLNVADRRFAFNGSTFLVRGHGAALPRYVREEEADGRLVMFVERDERLMTYIHDPVAEAEAAAEAEAEAAQAAGDSETPDEAASE